MVDVYGGIVVSLGAVILGILLMTRGSAALVESSAHLARRIGVSEFFVGATVVAFGTSAPEMFVSIGSNLQGQTAVTVGNVVGSNISNALLILGMAAIAVPVQFSQRMVMRDVIVGLAATIAFSGLALHGLVGRLTGVVLLVAFVAYLAWQFFEDRPEKVARGRESGEGSTARHVVIIAFSLAALLAGTEFLLQGALFMGHMVGVPDVFMALTVVALGTSLPELATSLAATIEKKPDILVGNIVGSNIFNILVIMGITSLVSPIQLAGTLDWLDIATFVGSAAALVFWAGRRRMGRAEGVVIFLLYVAYVVARYRMG